MLSDIQYVPHDHRRSLNNLVFGVYRMSLSTDRKKCHRFQNLNLKSTCSRVCIRVGLIASRISTANAPLTPMSSAVTGSPVLCYCPIWAGIQCSQSWEHKTLILGWISCKIQVTSLPCHHVHMPSRLLRVTSFFRLATCFIMTDRRQAVVQTKLT